MARNKYIEKLREDMILRGLSESTQKSYERVVNEFLAYSGKEPRELDERDVRKYSLELIGRGYKGSTFNTYQAAIRFFFAVTLNRGMNYLQIPRMKMEKKLPEILSREEIALLLERCGNLKHKAIFALAYGSGLRRSEICRLKVQDIDSKHMRVFVRDGKGGKDRYTILSQSCLEILRDYWRAYRPKHPEGWLFLGLSNHTHIVASGIDLAMQKWLREAGISKHVNFHSLRHAFATYLLQDGTDIFTIKELMGHRSISSTTLYLRMAAPDVTSPADRLYNYVR